MVATSGDGVAFSNPLTSIKSTWCFQRAVSFGRELSVYVWGCKTVELDGGSGPNGGTVCFRCSPDDFTLVGFVSKSSSAFNRPSESTRTKSKRRMWDPAGPEFESGDNDAEQIYNDGCNIAYKSQDADDEQCGPSVAQDDHKAEAEDDAATRRTISLARKEGRLPADVKIRLLASSSCFTEDELERMAVEQDLRRGSTVQQFSGSCNARLKVERLPIPHNAFP